MPSGSKKNQSKKIKISNDYEKIMKRAQKQPGLKELMKVYGQYDQLKKQSQLYLNKLHTTESFSVSSSSQ